MQEDEAALTEPARKKQKVTEGLIPFLVDENDALGTIRKVSMAKLYVHRPPRA